MAASSQLRPFIPAPGEVRNGPTSWLNELGPVQLRVSQWSGSSRLTEIRLMYVLGKSLFRNEWAASGCEVSNALRDTPRRPPAVLPESKASSALARAKADFLTALVSVGFLVLALLKDLEVTLPLCFRCCDFFGIRFCGVRCNLNSLLPGKSMIYCGEDSD
jgi:hypothetical protein